MAESIRIEVAYARPDRQVVREVEVAPGTSAVQAVVESGLLEQFPEIDLASNRIGIFGKLCKPDRVLAAGDRVEIYRPLVGDPKEIRRQLAAQGRVMGKKQRQ